MHTDRQIKLFRNGRNQAVRIPREFELPGDRATIRRQGEQLIIEAVKPHPLLDLLASLQALDEDFPEIEELPIESVES